MANSTTEEKCDCPLECDGIYYSYYFVSSPLNPDKMCPGEDNKGSFLMKEFYSNPIPPKLLLKMMKFGFNTSEDVVDICKKNIKYKAEIFFKLATNTMSITITSRRLSFFDKLSGFGNYKFLIVI